MIQVYNRLKQQYILEEQYGKKALKFMYDTAVGRLLLKLAINPVFSKVNGWYNQSSISRRKIKPLIEQYHIDCSQFEDIRYKSYNDFFVRKKKAEYLPAGLETGTIISPADAKLMVYDIKDNLQLLIKSSVYTIDSLLEDKKLGETYRGGTCLVYRLSLDDYHRYCYVADGHLSEEVVIPGKLHTVSSISADYNVYSENYRHYQEIKDVELPAIIQMEIGAMLVGKINNHPCEIAVKANEKGYFSFGGSTIVVLYKANTIRIHSDILEETKKGYETKVGYGEVIGETIC